MSDLSTSQGFRDRISTTKMSTQIKAAMKINYPTKVEFNKEEYIYLLMQLFAEMGGYASFLLGFSLLDVVTYIKNKMDWINETPLEMKTEVDGNNISLLP